MKDLETEVAIYLRLVSHIDVHKPKSAHYKAALKHLREMYDTFGRDRVRKELGL